MWDVVLIRYAADPAEAPRLGHDYRPSPSPPPFPHTRILLTLAHGRDPHPVRPRHAADGNGLKQLGEVRVLREALGGERARDRDRGRGDEPVRVVWRRGVGERRKGGGVGAGH